MTWRRVLPVLAIACASACARDGVYRSGPERAGLELEVVEWDSLQTVSVDGNVSPPTVRVVDENGIPQAGVAIRYAFVEHVPQTFTAGADTTNEMGEWRVTAWVPGRRALRQEIAVYIAGTTTGGAQHFSVDVRPGSPVSLGIDRDSLRIAVGAVFDPGEIPGVDAYGNPWNYADEVQFSTEDPAVAEVMEDGRIRGVAEGRTTLIIQAGFRQFFTWVVVGDPPTLSLENLFQANIASMELSLDGRLYLVGNGDAVRLWRFDLASTALDSVALPVVGLSVAVSPDGDLVAVAPNPFTNLRAVWLVTAASLSISDSIRLQRLAWDLRYSEDGAYLFVTDAEGLLRLDVATGDTVKFRLGLSVHSPVALAVHESLPHAYVAIDGSLFVLNYLTGAVIAVEGGVGEVRQLTLDQGRNRILATGLLGPAVVAYDATTLREVARSLDVGGGYSVAVSPDGGRIYVAGNGRLRVYAASLLLPLESIDLPQAVRVIAAPDGRVYVTSGDGLWRTGPP